ncbi:hypothetical protein [Streptomyces sp. NPDC048442]|uniref:hypothetical protein n=1 Tax=Streptomyces sp. NPDC048442 TaxID=3154823 RepID=UPI0034288D71
MESLPYLSRRKGKGNGRKRLYAVLPALSTSYLLLGSQEFSVHVCASVLLGCSAAVVTNEALPHRTSRPQGAVTGHVDYTRIALLEHELLGIQPPEGSEAARLIRDAARREHP